ncbi:MAG: hypothetical protein ACM32H_03255 [Candidatus Aminicenantes bacterium RBG_16_66_30]
MNLTPARPTRPILFATALLFLLQLFAPACQRRPRLPELVVFATGNLWGQLEVCG